MRASSRSVEEVAGAGEVHRHAGVLAGLDASARRGPSRPAGRSPGRRRRSGSAGRPRTGRTRRTPPPSPRPAPPPASTARRQESTRLTWPMPMPTEAPSWASRIALDFTARQARQANARSASTSSEAASPVARVQVDGSSPGSVDVVDPLHQQRRRRSPRNSTRSGCASAAHTQDPDVLLGLQHLDRTVLVAGRHDHLGEHLGDLLGHLAGHRPVGRDHAAERRDRVARVRLAVGLGDVGAGRDAARVGVLDDRHGRLVEVVGRPAGGVGVDVVVVGHLLAVQLLGCGQAGPRQCGVERGRLVRVLAVAQHRLPCPRWRRCTPGSRCRRWCR